MTVDTKGFHRAHLDLQERTAELREAAAAFPELTHAERAETRRRLLAYLRDVVAPHTVLDERLLYPETARRLGDALLAASMSYDHLAIRRWIDDLAAADPGDVRRIQELLYGLDALIRVHIWKEDELFLAPLERADPLRAGG